MISLLHFPNHWIMRKVGCSVGFGGVAELGGAGGIISTVEALEEGGEGGFWEVEEQ